MDIKETIEKTVDKIKNDKDFQEEFKKNPVKAVEKVTGVDLPDDMVEKVVIHEVSVALVMCTGETYILVEVY